MTSSIPSCVECIERNIAVANAWHKGFVIALVVSTVVVIFGVVLEEGDKLAKWLRIRITEVDPNSGIVRLRHKRKEVIERIEAFGWILVIFGVLGEGVFEVAVFHEDSTLERLNGALLQVARQQTSAVDLKRLELANRIVDIFGPRKLTTEQSARIAGKLKGLKGVKIDVYVLSAGYPYSASDIEDSRNIAHSVIRTLRMEPALMDTEGWTLDSCIGAGAANVVVTVPAADRVDNDRRIAKRLREAFGPEISTDPKPSDQPPYLNCGKPSPLDGPKANKRKSDANISITIGSKVQPLLTREMLEPK